MLYTNHPSKEDCHRVAEILVTAHPSLGTDGEKIVGMWPQRISTKFDQLRVELKKSGAVAVKPGSGSLGNPEFPPSGNVRGLDNSPGPHSTSGSGPQTSGNLRDCAFPKQFNIPRWPPLLQSTLSSADEKCRETGQKFEPPKKFLTELLGALVAEIFKYTYYPTDDNVKVLGFLFYLFYFVYLFFERYVIAFHLANNLNFLIPVLRI